MKKILRLTESDLIKLINRTLKLIRENSTPEYDEILDLYNEVGLEGMSEDEKEFLKSGGKTKLPNRFKTRNLLDKHKETTKSHEDWQKSIAATSDSISGKESKPIIPSKNEESYSKIRKLKRFLKKHSDWEIDYPYEGAAWGLGTLFQILFKDKNLFDDLIKILYDNKENYENDKSMIKNVHIRTKEDWSEEYNSHREPEDIPGSEYKIAVTIPKNWFEDLFGDHF